MGIPIQSFLDLVFLPTTTGNRQTRNGRFFFKGQASKKDLPKSQETKREGTSWGQDQLHPPERVSCFIIFLTWAE